MERLWRTMDAEAPDGAPSSAPFAPYVIAAALIAAGTVVRLLLDPILGDHVVFLFFVPAVLVAAAGGGIAPALTATVAATMVGFGVLAGHGVTISSLIDALLFVLLGGAIAVGGRQLRRTQLGFLEANWRLAERETYLQSVLNTVPDAMIVIDDKGIIESFSPAAERLFGWTAAEVQGKNVSTLMPMPDEAAHDSYLDRYRHTREARIIGKGRVVLAKRRDGGTFPAALSVGEMNLSGRTFFTGFIQDLTEREEAEKRLQTLQSELVHISRLSAMGEMGSTLAHELNQPLSAISNYLKGGKRLLEGGNATGAIQAMDKASEQSLRAGQIIRRLREFVARGESERKVENLPKLLEEASTMALMGAKERGVRVRVQRDPKVDQVLVDKVQVQQVILNLVRNALEAMDESPRRELLLSLAADPEDDQMARITVVDTGPGISPEIADRLFQPFVTTKGGQGMGVGLSICRTIVEGHGGRIWVEPNPGGGTAFQFTVPRAEADAGAEEAFHGV